MSKRWLKLVKKIWDSNLGTLNYPYKLIYVVTKECHSKCLNCHIWKVKPQNELTLDEIRKFAQNSTYFSWIDFIGGEPTDRKDFVELVEVFLENCPDLLLVHFPTNGLKTKRILSMSEQLARKCPKLVVSVSIDGPPEVNDRLRGIPNDFDSAIKTYIGLKNIENVDTYIGMTLYPETVNLVTATVDAIKQRVPEFTYKDLHVNLPHISEHYYENTSTSPQMTEDMNGAIQELMKLRGMPIRPFEIVERMYHRRVKKYIETRKTPEDCASLMASCYLSENGTVYPCNIWNEPLGNIRDTGYKLEPLLRTDRALELRRKIINKECPNCWTPCEAYQSLFANLWPIKQVRSLSRQVKCRLR
jgi:Fe-coproporphyrin III synthase